MGPYKFSWPAILILKAALPVVQSILNHKRIQSTMRYSHPMVEQKKDALEALSHYAG